MNLGWVASYVAVIDTGGFRAAADRLCATQGAISQQVRKLEAEVGTTLVVRDPAGCRPARGTEAFLRYARTLLDLSDRAERLFSDPEIVVGAASNIGIYLLQPWLKAISDAQGSRFRVRQMLGTNPDVIENLVRGDVDVAIAEWWIPRPGFEANVWKEEELVVVVGPNHPWNGRDTVGVDELASQVMLGGERATGTGTLLRSVMGAAVERIPAAIDLGSTAAVKEAVHAGLGISLILRGAAAPDVDAGRLSALTVDGLALRKTLWISRRAALFPEDPAALFADAMMSLTPA